jgi:DNA-binding winged helix-turn-helix (wHTH) protein/tetratricopeptide (TPR) repeat protein
MTAVAKSPAALSFAGFRLDLADERLWGPNGPIKLGNKAFQVLAMLAEQEGRLLTKDDLFSSVWDGTIVSEAALTSVIKEIRRALGDESRTPRFIESVYGRGYRFLAEVQRGIASGEAKAAPAESASASTRAQRSDLALLYIPAFDDAAMPERQRHLSIVLREEIVSALSRFHDIRLVSNAESATTGGRGFGDRDYQLSVRLIHDGQSVRAFARISRLATQAIIWADNIELPDANPGQSVEQLVRRIVAAALPRLQDDVLTTVPDQPRGVYDQYLRNKLRMRSLDTLDEARRLAKSWEELIERDPAFAQSYPPLIRLYNTDFAYTGLGTTGPAERRRAYELAHKAVILDRTDSHLHTVKGFCHLWAGETMLARQHFQEALELNPHNSVRLNEVATAMMFLGELDEARALLDRCEALTPSATEAPNEEEGLLHLLREEYGQSASRLALARRTHPEDGTDRGFALKGELYALLAAAGSNAPDLAERSARWQAFMAERWALPKGPDEADLRAWVDFHNPLQDKAQRERFLALLDIALKAAPLAKRRTPEPARAESLSTRPRADPASSPAATEPS